jgi:uncharacterized protein YbjT (DUF2867 family)
MILVTGAAGVTGREVVKALLERGEAVRALVRDAERGRPLAELGAELAVGDLEDAATLAAGFHAVDRVYLLLPSVPTAPGQAANAIAAARPAGVGLIVRHSILASGEPGAYTEWNGAADRLVARSGIPFVTLRPSFFMQNLLWSAAEIAATGQFTLPVGDAVVSHIDVRDIAAVAATVLTEPGHAGRSYALTGPEALSYHQVAERLGTALGRPVKFVDLPEAEYRRVSLEAGQPEWLVAANVAIYDQARRGLFSPVTATVRALTGRDPIPFAQFAADYAASFVAPAA